MAEKILVVDDDPDIQDFCRIVLEAAGYRVVAATSAAEGKLQVSAENPDLILLDIIMEAADSGFEMAGWLARLHPGMPVIMLSSIADAADQVFDTSTLPVSVLLTKPITPKELLRRVEAALVPRPHRS